MSCGCNMPQADHNDYNNITYNSLLRAMIAGNVETMDQLIENMENTYELMQGVSEPTESADEGVSVDVGPS